MTDLYKQVAKFMDSLIVPGDDIDFETITKLAIEHFSNVDAETVKQQVKGHILINYVYNEVSFDYINRVMEKI